MPGQPPPQASDPRTGWSFLDLGTLVTLVVRSLFFARPLLEEWGLSNYWSANGVGNYLTLAKNYPLRPLQSLPSALAWIVGHGSTTGFALAFAAVQVAKYVAMRWAIGRFVHAASGVACSLDGRRADPLGGRLADAVRRRRTRRRAPLRRARRPAAQRRPADGALDDRGGRDRSA